MIRLFLGDAFKFDYRTNIGQVDFIFSSPPFFLKDSKFNFAYTGKEHYGKLFNLISKIIKQLKVKRALIHCGEDLFVLMKKKEERIIKHKANIVIPEKGGWKVIDKEDVKELLGRYAPPVYDSILDPFCGIGSLLLESKKLGTKNVYGIDQSKDQLGIAVSKIKELGYSAMVEGGI